MSPMILLLGASGYVGSIFHRHLQNRGLEYSAPLRSSVDYGRPHLLAELLDGVRPSYVINAVGFTGIPNVEATERQKPRCLEANLAFPVRLAALCSARGIALGHVSTGCIYSGKADDGGGWRETDRPNFDFRHNNSSFYSGCKALAEEVLADYPPVWIWRLRRPFNQDAVPRNYLSKVMGYPKHLETVNSISQIDEFVAGCLDLWKAGAPAGFYNLTNPGVVKTSEITALMERYGRIPGPAAFFSSNQEFVAVAGATPRSECVLDSSKAMDLGVRFTEIHEALDQALRAWAEPKT